MSSYGNVVHMGILAKSFLFTVWPNTHRWIISDFLSKCTKLFFKIASLWSTEWNLTMKTPSGCATVLLYPLFPYNLRKNPSMTCTSGLAPSTKQATDELQNWISVCTPFISIHWIFSQWCSSGGTKSNFIPKFGAMESVPSICSVFSTSFT